MNTSTDERAQRVSSRTHLHRRRVVGEPWGQGNLGVSAGAGRPWVAAWETAVRAMVQGKGNEQGTA